MKQKKKMNKKEKRTKHNEEKCEISEDFSGFWLHTQNPQRFLGGAVVVVTFSDEILDDFHAFFGMCLFRKENQQPILEVTVFPMNSGNVHGT